jgi:hypothetical protein
MAKKSKKKSNKNKASTNTGKSSINNEPKSIQLSPDTSSDLATSNPVPDAASLEEIQFLPPSLLDVYPNLSVKQQSLVKLLCSPEMGQSHLFETWPLDSQYDAKITFIEQLENLNETCPNGITSCMTVEEKLQISNNSREKIELDIDHISSVGFVITVEDDEASNNVSLWSQ